MEILPRRYWIGINELLVRYGQAVCTPLSPRCSVCPASRCCARVGVGRITVKVTAGILEAERARAHRPEKAGKAHGGKVGVPRGKDRTGGVSRGVTRPRARRRSWTCARASGSFSAAPPTKATASAWSSWSTVSRVSREPRCLREHEELRWVAPEDLLHLRPGGFRPAGRGNPVSLRPERGR